MTQPTNFGERAVAAAYLAEVVRGGLQALPKGQYEAAEALGLSERSVQRDWALARAWLKTYLSA